VGHSIHSEADARSAAEHLHCHGPLIILICGLDFAGVLLDVLFDGRQQVTCQSPSGHGQMDIEESWIMASAVSASLALGRNVREAALATRFYVADAPRRPG